MKKSLTWISPGVYRHERLGVEVQKTAMPGTPWQLAGADPDSSGIVFARTLGDARAFVGEIEEYVEHACASRAEEAGAGERPSAQDAERALLALHRYLFPERYEDVPMYKWHAGTIEDVADILERALAGDPRAQLSPK